MVKDRSRKGASPPGAAMTGALTLLFILCLAECATGSCLSYGHSCWGAHGKRSANPSPEWFLNVLQRVNSVDNDLVRRAVRAYKNDDANDIYQRDAPIDSRSTDRLRPNIEVFSLNMAANRNMEAKPMLDDEMLSKMKLWEIMRESSLEK